MGPAPTHVSRQKLQAVRAAVQNRLLPWFEEHQRDLPWRRKRTPYRVWISEAMLAQTRVDTVIPYFGRFMKRFPSLRALAAAPLDDVLKQWEGLGYYSRARNLHKAARLIDENYRGRFPRAYVEILALPGVGPYTAAAIASLAFNLDHAVLDGNVIRVLCRVTGFDQDPSRNQNKQQLQAIADRLLVPGQAAICNEAMMELGAICCTPTSPTCQSCPLQSVCVAFRTGRVADLPVRFPKKAVPHKEVGAAVVCDEQGNVLIAQRLATSMLGGLWEFPGGTQESDETMPECVARELKEELDIDIEVGDRLMIVRHAYSHFTIALHVYWATIQSGVPRPIECADVRWCAIPDLRTYAFSRADLHIVDRLCESEI